MSCIRPALTVGITQLHHLPAELCMFTPSRINQDNFAGMFYICFTKHPFILLYNAVYTREEFYLLNNK